jgi:hypothetical protein
VGETLPSHKSKKSEPAPSTADGRTIPKSSNTKADRTTDKEPSKLSNDWGLSDKIAVVAIVVGFLQFLVLLATVLVMMLVATRQLRAYISVAKAGVFAAMPNGLLVIPEEQIATGARPTSILEFENFGQTPAYDVVFYGDIALVPWPLDPASLPAVDMSVGRSKEILGPGGTRKKFDIPDDRFPSLTDGDLEGLRTGRLAIFVYGEVRYRDIFKRKRHTEYRWFIGGPTGMRGTMLAAHDQGNNAS